VRRSGRPGLAALDRWVSQVGAHPLYLMWYTDWSTGFQSYAVTNAHARGARRSSLGDEEPQSAIPYADVLAGRWNRYLDAWVAAAKADGRPLFVRFGHEMTATGTVERRAERRVRRGGLAVRGRMALRARPLHARRRHQRHLGVVPQRRVGARAPWNAASNYYPGDAYVDWTCADGYNWGTSQTVATAGWSSRWQTFDQVFGAVYAESRSSRRASRS
jgi:hypothetical protein